VVRTRGRDARWQQRWRSFFHQGAGSRPGSVRFFRDMEEAVPEEHPSIRSWGCYLVGFFFFPPGLAGCDWWWPALFTGGVCPRQPLVKFPARREIGVSHGARPNERASVSQLIPAARLESSSCGLVCWSYLVGGFATGPLVKSFFLYQVQEPALDVLDLCGGVVFALSTIRLMPAGLLPALQSGFLSTPGGLCEGGKTPSRCPRLESVLPKGPSP